VRDGEVDHGEASPFALMDFEREEGKALACCATLQSDVVIEAEIDEEPDAASSRSRTSRPGHPHRAPHPHHQGLPLRPGPADGLPGRPVREPGDPRAGPAPGLLAGQPAPHRCRHRAACAPGAGRAGHHLAARTAAGGRRAAAQRPLRPLLRAPVGHRAACRCCSWRAARACPARADDPGPAGPGLGPAHHPGLRPAPPGRALRPRGIPRPGARTPLRYVPPCLSHEPEDSGWTGARALCTTRPRPASTTTSAATRPTSAGRRHDRRLHQHPDAGAAVRARHPHREVPLGGRCRAGAQPLFKAL
jgi:hypothetical protein